MLSPESHLSLEPLFCKSTGAYRAQVAHFCHFEQPVAGAFELSRAVKPSALDSDSWPQTLPASTQLKLHKDVVIKQHVRSVLNRTKTDVTIMIHPKSGFIVEFNHFPRLDETHPTTWSVTSLLETHEENFASLAIGLIRHGIFTCEEEAQFRSSRPTRNFRTEDGVEILCLEARTIVRSVTSGRAVDLTDTPSVAGLIGSKQMFQSEASDADAFEYLCRLGLLRQIGGIE